MLHSQVPAGHKESCETSWFPPSGTFIHSTQRPFMSRDSISQSQCPRVSISIPSFVILLFQTPRELNRINILILRIIQQPRRHPLPPLPPKIPPNPLRRLLRVQIIRKLQTRNLISPFLQEPYHQRTIQPKDNAKADSSGRGLQRTLRQNEFHLLIP
jgi:hypothetical protein